MKSFLTAVALSIASFFLYQHLGKSADSAPPLVIEEPVFAHMRASANIEGREVELAVFVKAASMAECEAESRASWTDTLDSCPTCTLQTPQCHEQLSARYARLFDDEPIPSAYLSATAGSAAERDGRIVVYGLTDDEGRAMCGLLRSKMEQKYKGTLKCIDPAKG